MDLDLDASWWEKRKRKRGEREREREREREMMDSGEWWWMVVNFGRCGEWWFEGVKYGGPTWERERDEKNMNLFSFGEKVLLPKEMREESMLKFFG